MWFLDM